MHKDAELTEDTLISIVIFNIREYCQCYKEKKITILYHKLVSLERIKLTIKHVISTSLHGKSW